MSSMFKFIKLGFSWISGLCFSWVADRTLHEIGHFDKAFVLCCSIELFKFFCFQELRLVSCFMLSLSLHLFLYDSVGFENQCWMGLMTETWSSCFFISWLKSIEIRCLGFDFRSFWSEWKESHLEFKQLLFVLSGLLEVAQGATVWKEEMLSL